MGQKIQQNYQVSRELAGQRLDQAAVVLFSDYSRGRIQQWIKSGELTVDGRQAKPKEKLFGGETLRLEAILADDTRWDPEPMDLEVLYSDEHIIVINKPKGLVVHPGAGTPSGTLLNGLLHRFPELAQIPRAGIVHRLDKDTTGLMVVARSLLAHADLIQQLQERTVGREYEAIAMGELTGGGVVDKPIGRHPTQRTKMAVIDKRFARLGGRDGDDEPYSAKEAITHYRLLKRYRGYSHIACRLETGRTHQIRVHMAYLKYPLVGDEVYTGRNRCTAGTPEPLKSAVMSFPRQALHARSLTLFHPASGESLTWSAPLPEDMQALLALLDEDANSHPA